MRNSSNTTAGLFSTQRVNQFSSGSNTNLQVRINPSFSLFQNAMFGVAIFIFIWMNIENLGA